MIDAKKAKSRVYYNLLLQNITKPPTATTNWVTILNTNNEQYLQSYGMHKQGIKNTKLLAFQYKLLNNILATNDNLYKWKCKPNPLCSYCDFDDTNIHCLWECNTTKNWLDQCMTILDKRITCNEYILGTPDNALNHLLLLTKYYIWKKRSQEEIYSSFEYRSIIKQPILADQCSLSQQCFRIKWSNFTHLLE